MVETVSDIINKVSPYYAKRKKPESEHTIVYDSTSETLEPIYFFILDLMNDFGLKPQKYTDNFASSPGSGHFQELGTRATVMQQQASNALANVGTVLRSIMNIVYDLKEWKVFLQAYDDLKSSDKNKREASRLSLKQRWMDKVDIVKGGGSINALTTGQLGFQTLREAFLMVNEPKAVNKMDLNDRVKRILKMRIQEFNTWLEHSQKESRKRYEIERNYLQSQANSLKLYSRWAKPYLKAASQLEMKEMGREPALVKTFNTILLELTLLGKLPIKVKDAALEGKLPAEFVKEGFLKSLKRGYHLCILVDFKFRGLPTRLPTQQSHYVFGGRAEVTFKSYALNDDELKKLDKEMEESEFADVLGLIEGATTQSLDQIQEEINFFLKEKEEEEKKGSKSSSNPFMALIGKYENPKKEENKPKAKTKELIVSKDNWIESTHFRPLAAQSAEAIAFDLFDIYKKAHGMVSFT